MAKIDYTKVENALRDSINKKFIQDLNELAAMANMTHADRADIVSKEELQKLIGHFQKELKRIRKEDPDFFSSLEISKDIEKKFFGSNPELDSNDWSYLKGLKEKIDAWKKTLKPRQAKEEDVEHIEAIRKKQKDARFNVNPKWRPL